MCLDFLRTLLRLDISRARQVFEDCSGSFSNRMNVVTTIGFLQGNVSDGKHLVQQCSDLYLQELGLYDLEAALPMACLSCLCRRLYAY